MHRYGSLLLVLSTFAYGAEAGTSEGKPPDLEPGTGINVSLNGLRPFPADNPWNTPVDQALVDPTPTR